MAGGFYISHYGRKGMKWGKNIFGDDDAVSRWNASAQNVASRRQQTANQWNQEAQNRQARTAAATSQWESVRNRNSANTRWKQAAQDVADRYRVATNRWTNRNQTATPYDAAATKRLTTAKNNSAVNKHLDAVRGKNSSNKITTQLITEPENEPIRTEMVTVGGPKNSSDALRRAMSNAASFNRAATQPAASVPSVRNGKISDMTALAKKYPNVSKEYLEELYENSGRNASEVDEYIKNQRSATKQKTENNSSSGLKSLMQKYPNVSKEYLNELLWYYSGNEAKVAEYINRTRIGHGKTAQQINKRYTYE